MKRIKSGLIVFIIGVMTLSSIPILGSNTMEVTRASLTYYFDGEKKEPPSDQQGFIVNGSTYVPLRFVAESMGKKAVWEGETRSVHISADPKYLPEGQEREEEDYGQSRVQQIHDGWLYQIEGEADNQRLYKSRVNNSEKELLSHIQTTQFYVTDDWVYVIQNALDESLNDADAELLQDKSLGKHQIARMKHDGSLFTKIIDSEDIIVSFDLEEDEIFYYTEKANAHKLYKSLEISVARLNGDRNGKFIHSIRKPIDIGDGWRYFVSVTGKIARTRIYEDANERLLVDTDLSIYDFVERHGDWIYYQDKKGDLYKVSLDGSAHKKLLQGIMTKPFIQDGWIYYTDPISDDPQRVVNLYRIKEDGTQHMVIYQGVGDMVVKKDGIYFIDQWDSSNLYRIDLGGENKTFIQSDVLSIIDIKDSNYFMMIDEDATREIIKVPVEIDPIPDTIASKQLVKHNGWIYYIGQGNGLHLYEDEWKQYLNQGKDMSLYKMKPDGSKKTKIVDGFVTNVALVQDWIYYTINDRQEGFPNTILYKMKIGGNSKTKIIDEGWIEKFYIVDNTIYLKSTIDGTNSKRGYIYTQLSKVDVNGKNKDIINSNNFQLVHIEAGKMYFRIDANDLFSAKVGGGNTNMLSRTLTDSEVFYKNWIYYVDPYKDRRIMKMKLDGSEKQAVTTQGQDATNEMFIKDDWIYYIDYQGNLFRIKIDGSGYQKLNDDYDVYDIIGNIEEWMYYIDKNGYMKRMKLNGSMGQAI